MALGVHAGMPPHLLGWGASRVLSACPHPPVRTNLGNHRRGCAPVQGGLEGVLLPRARLSLDSSEGALVTVSLQFFHKDLLEGQGQADLETVPERQRGGEGWGSD